MRTLTISQSFDQAKTADLGLSYRLVANRLASAHLNGDVLPGVSVVDGEVEERVEIRLFDATHGQVERLWASLKDTFNLRCAWYDDGEGYCGCVLLYPALQEADRWHYVPKPFPEDTTRRTAAHGDALIPAGA